MKTMQLDLKGKDSWDSWNENNEEKVQLEPILDLKGKYKRSLFEFKARGKYIYCWGLLVWVGEGKYRWCLYTVAEMERKIRFHIFATMLANIS